MIRRPPRSTRTDNAFPTRRSSDLIEANAFCQRRIAQVDDCIIGAVQMASDRAADDAQTRGDVFERPAIAIEQDPDLPRPFGLVDQPGRNLQRVGDPFTILPGLRLPAHFGKGTPPWPISPLAARRESGACGTGESGRV